MDEATTHSLEYQEKPLSPTSSKISTDTNATAIPAGATAAPDDNHLELQISSLAERSVNPESDQAPSPATTTTTVTLPLELQMDAFSEPCIYPTFDEAAASPTPIPDLTPSPTPISTAAVAPGQMGHAAAAAEPGTVPPFPTEAAIEQSFLEETEKEKNTIPSTERISPEVSEQQTSQKPSSVSISASAIPTDQNAAVSETLKDENGFIFYKCRFCGLTYNYLTTLRAHERVHNIDEPYKCNRCSESFHYMCELEYHAKQHTDLKGYKCECGRTFHTYTDLLYHKHPGDEIEEAVVVTAPIVTSMSAPRIPESEFPVPEFIEKGFEPKHPLKVYSDVRLNPYICQYCSKSYPNSRMLAYHMYGHRGEKIFNPRASRYLMARTENSYISPGV